MPEDSEEDTGEDSGRKTTKTVQPSTPPSSSSDGSAISAYDWCAGLGAIGFLETSYLTYIKLTNSDAFCPVGGGGTCGSVLNSDYSVVFGIKAILSFDSTSFRVGLDKKGNSLWSDRVVHCCFLLY
jgi:hypothetical protein